MKTQPAKILIIEDEIVLVKALNLLLVNEGYDVYHAADGEKGMAIIKKIKPDLVLLDLLMPVMDGKAVLEAIRKSKNAKISKIPVIILSNLNLGEKIDKDNDHGLANYFVKAEVAMEVLTKEINKILKDA